MTERELVRCGCGVVRNDEDALVSMAFAWMILTSEFLELEPPRTCRGCGGFYALPKPSAPKETNENAK